MKVTFCKTKAGKGFKIAVGDQWLYVGTKYLYRVLYNKAQSCQFRPIVNGSSANSDTVEFENPFE